MRTIIFYGDSNTHGFDPRDYFGGRYDENVIWTARLAKAQEGFWKVLNEGMNGRQLPGGGADRKYAEMLIGLLAPADVFCMMLGTNDLLMTLKPDAGKPIEKMENFLKWFCGKEKFPRLFVLAPPYIGTGKEKDRLFQEYHRESIRMNQGFRRLAEQYGVMFADASQWNIDLAYDGVHFSEKGHLQFAEQMDSVLKTMRENP